MCEFLFGSLHEDGGYLFVTLLTGHFGENSIAAAGLRFACERFQKIDFGACAFYVFLVHNCWVFELCFLFLLSNYNRLTR